MKKCIIIGASPILTQPDTTDSELIIAADGGFDNAKKMGITPDLFIGDMDSLTSPLPPSLEKKTFPERKDYTDMYLCYLEGKERGCTEFEIYGGTGGRGDHTFANISLLLAMACDGCSGKMITDSEIYTVVKNGSVSISGTVGNYISVFAIGGEAHGVTLSELDYLLNNASLTPDFPLGVSNKFINTKAEISVDDGALLVIWQI